MTAKTKSNFAGFPAEGIAFLRALAKNNDREWFAPRKTIYDEKVKGPMIGLISAVHEAMLRFAPEYVGDPAKSIFRIYRDTRFSKDKTPYKTHIAASLRRTSMGKEAGAGFYFSVSPKEVAVGGGLWHPPPNSLSTVRHHLADHHREFRTTFDSRRVRTLVGEIMGETLTRVPKGFDPEHPAADLLKMKSLFFYTELDPKLATSPKLAAEFSKRIEAIAPFIEFLNRPLIAAQRKSARDERFFA